MPELKLLPKRFYKLRAILSAVALLALISGATVVHADQFDEQIRALRAQNSDAQSVINDLTSKANSYEDTIYQLQVQINVIQSALDANQVRQAELQQQIVDAENKIKLQKTFLGQNITAMYVDGQLSTIEELATSKSLSEFVDKEEYRIIAQNKIDITIKQIAVLQAELQKQKLEVSQLIASQQQQSEQLASAENQQQRLLSYNEGQQSAYNHQIGANKSKIAQLQAAQVAANRQLFSGGSGNSRPGIPGGGGYSWGDAVCLHAGVPDPPCGQYDWGYPSAPYPSNLFDTWGYGYRNCTSWVAFRLNQTGYSGFARLGNAADWPGNVPASWKSYGSGAQRGDAAVSPSGGYGHVMYVEQVNGDGTVTVSDYNRLGDGLYRGASTISQSGLIFIHFPS